MLERKAPFIKMHQADKGSTFWKQQHNLADTTIAQAKLLLSDRVLLPIDRMDKYLADELLPAWQNLVNSTENTQGDPAEHREGLMNELNQLLPSDKQLTLSMLEI